MVYNQVTSYRLPAFESGEFNTLRWKKLLAKIQEIQELSATL